MATANIIDTLSADEQAILAARVVQWVNEDLGSRSKWETQQDEAMKLWALEPPRRTLPFQGGSNICVPVIFSAVNNWSGLTQASMFESPYPERVRCIPAEANDVKRAERCEQFMNWQVTFQMADEYESSYDALLPELAIVGTAFKKVTWDEDEERARTEFVSALDVIVPNDTKCLKDARRVTHRQKQHLDAIKWDLGAGDKPFYKNVDRVQPAAAQQENPVKTSEAARLGLELTEENAEISVYETDFRGKVTEKGERGDYTVWVTSSGIPLRLVERPKKRWQKYIDFHFIPSPTGDFYSYGFGHFLKPINLAFNAVFNQTIDAGRLSISPFILYGRTAGFKGKNLTVRPGAAEMIDDVTQVLVTKFPGLDPNIFAMMSFLKDFGSDVSANTDEMQGRVQRGVREPTARGQESRTGRAFGRFKIYAKRVFRSQAEEYRAIFDLNSLYLSDEMQYRVAGSTVQPGFATVYRKDFGKRLDVLTTADPEFASPERRRSEAYDLLNLVLQGMGVQNPGAAQVFTPELLQAALKDVLTTYGKPDVARYVPDPPEMPVPPDAENELMLEGERILPKSGENHDEHLSTHALFMGTELFGRQDEAIKRTFMEHVVRTRALAAAQKQIEQDAQQQAAMQQQQGQQQQGQGPPAPPEQQEGETPGAMM